MKSKRGKIGLLLVLVFGSTVCADLELKINLEERHQEIDSFGASDAWSINPAINKWSEAGDEEAIERLADLLFSETKGIGLSAWRFNVGAGSFEQGKASAIRDPYRRAELLFRIQILVSILLSRLGRCGF